MSVSVATGAAMIKTYSVETFGCQMNVHDSEKIAGLLEKAGYRQAEKDHPEPDLLVVNTCSVRERAEEKLYARLDHYRKKPRSERPLIAVTGCVAQQEGAKILDRTPAVDVGLGTQALSRLPEALKSIANGRFPAIDIDTAREDQIPTGTPKRLSAQKAFITIIEGCNDFCSFCVVPYTRGHERMRNAREILKEANLCADRGTKEITLLGQIVNHYQAPDLPECDFAGLLQLLNRVDGLERIRFTSPHPRHVTERLIDSIKALPKVCKHLHLPVQSGSTRILGLMRRRHTREHYLNLINKIRASIPDITISTDIIVGFPGENEKDFQETLKLVKEVKYNNIFSFKYSERPNTLAAHRIPDSTPEDIKSQRLTSLQSLQKTIQLEINRDMIGQTFEVLLEGRSRRRPQEQTGRTQGNTIVNFSGPIEDPGKLIKVAIEKASIHSVWGKSVT